MNKLPVTMVRSGRRTLSLEINREGEMIVRAPYNMPDKEIWSFVEQKSVWIEKHVVTAKENQKKRPKVTEEEAKALAVQAMEVIPSRVRYYADQMGVSYGRITIRRQKTRWGSCSSRGNLNFNLLLMLMPDKILDYVVVHELCHLREMNHSERFWAEVSSVLPDYKARRQWLKENGGQFHGND